MASFAMRPRGRKQSPFALAAPSICRVPGLAAPAPVPYPMLPSSGSGGTEAQSPFTGMFEDAASKDAGATKEQVGNLAALRIQMAMAAYQADEMAALNVLQKDDSDDHDGLTRSFG